MKKILLALAAIASLCSNVQAQNVEGQIVASQYGEFRVQNEGNGFTFSPANCQVTGGGKNFPAFSLGAPIKVVDSSPSLTEIDNPVGVFISSSYCSVSMVTTNQHASFYLTSGTGGLQEALNSAKVRAGGPNTIILNAEWYELVAPGNPATVIGAVTGGTGFGLVDITTVPYTYYSWNGTHFVSVGTGGSVASVFGRTGAVVAATNDYTVSQVTGAAPLASPALTGSPTAPTQASTDNSNLIATDAFVKANGSVPSVFGRTGAVTAQSGDYSVGQVTGAAPLASPALTGNPTAITQTAGDSTTKIATDQFVQTALGTLPNGATATTQPNGDNTTKVATDAFVQASAATLATYSSKGAVYGGIGYVNPSMITGGITDAFAAINAVAATLPTGSLIDATALGTATYTVTTPLTALNQTSKAIVLMLSPGTRFQINTVFSSPTNSPASCAVPVGGAISTAGTGSAIIVPGYNAINANFFLGSSAVVWDVICNGDFTGNQENMRLDGVYVAGNASATMSGALIHLAGVFIPTRISNSGTRNCYGQCLEIDAGTTGTGGPGIGDLLFDHDNFQDGITSGTYPGSVVNINALANTGETTKIIFLAGAIEDNGPHNPLITITGHGSNQNKEISFDHVDYETSPATTSGANPNVDPIQITDAGPVAFIGMDVQGAINSAAQTHIVDISQSISNNTWGINIQNLVAYSASGWTSLVHNTIDGTDETGYNSGNGFLALPNYTYGQIYPVIRQTNYAPPTATTGTLGTIWTNTTATQGAAQLNKLVNGTPTWVPLDATGSAVSPIQIGKIFYADGFPSSCTVAAVAYTTQGDCAFYTAANYATTNSQSVSLWFGAGTYTTAASFVEPNGNFIVNLFGGGQQITTIKYTGATAIPVISKALNGGIRTFMEMRDFTIDGNYIASADLDLLGLNQSYFSDMTGINIAPNKTYFIRFGSGFQVHAARMQAFENSGSGLGSFGAPTAYAYVTCTPSGGTIATAQCTLTNAGTGYPSGYATASIIFNGFQNGNSYRPCSTTQPVGTATIASGTVSTWSLTTSGTGCVGTMYGTIAAVFPSTYVFQSQVSDSTFLDITTYGGATAGIAALSSNDVWTHAHPVASPVGVYNDASNVFVGTELDTIYRYGFDLAGPACPNSTTTCGSSISGTTGFFGLRNLQAPATFYFEASSINVILGDQGGLCGGPIPNGWQEIATQTGTIDSGIGSWPAGVTMLGNDQSCNEVYGDFTPVINANHFVGTGAPAVAAGAGAGTSPTVAIANATDMSGVINVLTGTSPLGGQSLAIVTFGKAWAVAPNCTATPNNPATVALSVAQNAAIFSANTITTGFPLTSGPTILAASTQYSWQYKCSK